MTPEELKSRLCEKMEVEFNAYRDQLLSVSPQEILNHAYEYVIRDDIMETLDGATLSDKQMETLLKAESPLEKIVQVYKCKDTEYMDMILDSIVEAASSVMTAE